MKQQKLREKEIRVSEITRKKFIKKKQQNMPKKLRNKRPFVVQYRKM